MSQPNVVEAAKAVLEEWDACTGGEIQDFRVFNRLRESLAALPSGPCVVVPVELLKDIASEMHIAYDHHKGPLTPDSTSTLMRVDALLTAQMPQKEGT